MKNKVTMERLGEELSNTSSFTEQAGSLAERLERHECVDTWPAYASSTLQWVLPTRQERFVDVRTALLLRGGK
jgi:hypothetical protein